MCTGYGGMDEGIRSVIGGDLLWVADNDQAADKVLSVRYPDIRNIGDIRSHDWSQESVDLLTAGFPCQPVSLAGRKKGLKDERWLFDDIMEAVDRMAERPRVIMLENVKGLLTANDRQAMARVIGSLAARRYVGSYRIVRASDCGAPHRRERVFIIAWQQSSPHWLQAIPNTIHHGLHNPQGRTAYPRPSIPGLRNESGGEYEIWRQESEGDCSIRNSWNTEFDWGKWKTAVDHWTDIIGRPSPYPIEKGDPPRRSRTKERANGYVLSARFAEWVMGLPEGWVTEIPDITRSQKIKLIGNGCVPQQAALALRLLTLHLEGR